MTRSLDGAHVFLSASFPFGERGERWPQADAGAIAEAVTATVRTVLGLGGRLLFGGHPTITPLVLMVAHEAQVQGAVDVYQSAWFEDQITEATRQLESTGAGTIHMTAKHADLNSSLYVMRREMLDQTHIAGAVFIGGMSGIIDEHERFGIAHPGRPRLAVGGSGGAAATISADELTPTDLASLLRSSRQYPFVMAEAVGYLTDVE